MATTRVVSALVPQPYCHSSVRTIKGFQYTVPVAGKYIHKHRSFWNFNPDGAPGFRYTGGNTVVS